MESLFFAMVLLLSNKFRETVPLTQAYYALLSIACSFKVWLNM